MVQAAITIRSRSNLFRYTRDVVTDNYGYGTKYYGYRGNARRKLNLDNYNNSLLNKPTNLKRGVNYSFNVEVNAEAGATESFVNFGQENGNPVLYSELLHHVSKEGGDRFSLVWEDYDRSIEGLYFVAEGRQAGTSITVTDGSTGTPLFASLDSFVDIGAEVPSDNFFDQDAEAGQILFDLNTLVTNLENDTEYFLLFPESGGSTDTLVRESSEQKDALVFNKIVRSIIDNIHIYETVINVRNQFKMY